MKENRDYTYRPITISIVACLPPLISILTSLYFYIVWLLTILNAFKINVWMCDNVVLLYIYTILLWLHYWPSYITVNHIILDIWIMRRTQLSSKTVALVVRWCYRQLIILIFYWKHNIIGRDLNLLFIEHCNHFNENEYRTRHENCAIRTFPSYLVGFFSSIFFLNVTDIFLGYLLRCNNYTKFI